MTLKPVRRKVLAGYLRELKKAAKPTKAKRKTAVKKVAKKTVKKQNSHRHITGKNSLERSIVRLTKDSDHDGLSDYQEYLYGTDPYDPDTDHDGLSDYEEIKLFQTDPHNPDTNKNGITDGEEVKMGRNPRGQGLLKDLFIPYPGNNFQPNFLKPHRIAWYSITAVVIKAVVMLTIAIIPLSAWLTPDITQEQSQKIIALTNEIRGSLGLNELTVSNKLSDAAANKARDMVINQYFAHTSPRGHTLDYWLKNVNYNYDVAGENLAMGFSDANQVMNAWTKSKTHYSNIIDPSYREIGVAMVSGSYHDNDTTFVAQYFGSPKAATESNYQTKIVRQIISEPKDTSVSQADKSNVSPKILGQKTTLPPLVKPTLMSPETGSIFKVNELKLKILAPEAEAIYVIDNDRPIESAITNAGSYFEGTVNLDEGRHELSLKSVRGGEITTSSVYQLEIDQTAPIVDQKKTKIIVSTPPSRTEKAINVTAYLSPDTAKATVNFGNFNLPLTQDNEDPTKWTASAIIFAEDQEQIFNPVTLANISASDRVGNEAVQDINWQNITPVQPSIMNQYFYAKNFRTGYINWLFNFASIYFKLLLVLVVAALALSIFIEVKRQHLKLILPSAGLIALLIVLIIL